MRSGCCWGFISKICHKFQIFFYQFYALKTTLTLKFPIFLFFFYISSVKLSFIDDPHTLLWRVYDHQTYLHNCLFSISLALSNSHHRCRWIWWRMSKFTFHSLFIKNLKKSQFILMWSLFKWGRLSACAWLIEYKWEKWMMVWSGLCHSNAINAWLLS
jgi:hypothetical protein